MLRPHSAAWSRNIPTIVRVQPPSCSLGFARDELICCGNQRNSQTLLRRVGSNTHARFANRSSSLLPPVPRPGLRRTRLPRDLRHLPKLRLRPRRAANATRRSRSRGRRAPPADTPPPALASQRSPLNSSAGGFRPFLPHSRTRSAGPAHGRYPGLGHESRLHSPPVLVYRGTGAFTYTDHGSTRMAQRHGRWTIALKSACGLTACADSQHP